MNLTIFNAETTPTGRFGTKGSACISFSKSGVIRISNTACEAIGLKEGDKVALGQDPENPADWYVFKSKDGFEVRGTKGGSGLIFNQSNLSRMMIGSLDLDAGKSHRFLIAGQPTVIDKVKYFAILTISTQ